MEDTIAAISTAAAPGGIGIVRVSGGAARAVTGRVFRPAAAKKSLAAAPGYTALYGHIETPAGERVDEAVALVFAAPNSYTGEDVVELSCHGGLAVLRETLRLTLAAGARLAEPGEFTRRAFCNGKLSLTQAEAVMDVIGAESRQAARAAVAVQEGALARRLAALRDELTDLLAWLAAWSDFPEEEIEAVDPDTLAERLGALHAQTGALIAGFDAGRVVRDGIETVIAGCPNVGKSTLMNYLSGHESSIVTDTPGTTRDVVREEIQLGEWRLHLCDTAGLRQSADQIEQFGVQKARDRLETADLILAVLDASRPLTAEDVSLLQSCANRKAVAVLNKCDLPPALSPEAVRPYCPQVVCLSAARQTGREGLEEAITALFSTAGENPAAGVLCSERQLACARRMERSLTEAAAALTDGLTLDALSVCLDDALAALLELTGERVTEAVTNAVFARFCVGK